MELGDAPTAARDGARVRAVVVNELAGPGSCKLETIAAPTPAPGHLLLDVHVAGVTFPDLLLTRGAYQLRPAPPFVPGFEVAGIVRAAPAGCGLRPGQRAAGFVWTGGFAEQVAIPVGQAVPVAEEMSLEMAVALVVNYHTVLFALQHRTMLLPGETLLVHGGAGGVGTAAIQIGRALGARVLATARSEEAIRIAAKAGAEQVVGISGGWKDRIVALTGGRGVDVVVDPVGGTSFEDSVRCLAPEGRLLVVGFAAGGAIPSVQVNRLLLRNASVLGVAWGAFLEHDAELMSSANATLTKMVSEGYVTPIIGARYELGDAGAALRDLEARRFRGKAVLTVR